MVVTVLYQGHVFHYYVFLYSLFLHAVTGGF